MPPSLAHRTLRGAYHDSLVLMRLQRSLEELPGVHEAAAVMATPANRELLAERGLLPAEAGAGGGPAARADDLLVVVRAASEAAAGAALEGVAGLLAARGAPSTAAGAPAGAGVPASHRPRGLAGALRALPTARWVLVSVPGRWAGRVAREALAAGRHVFLYSDNVPVAEEVALKAEAARRGLLVLGPDCGTAIVAGAGLGFANRVARGAVGIVAASGTGLQAVACGLDDRGAGISHALGTGGRDLGAEVGGRTALAALDLLARDPDTRVIVLVSKPPAPAVAARLLRAALAARKPTVVWFLGAAPPARRLANLRFASDSADAAELAATLALQAPASSDPGNTTLSGRLLGLFSGGTLAAEALAALAPFLDPLASNLSNLGAPGTRTIAESAEAGDAHAILDLGADDQTAGRPHPMLDPAGVAERIRGAGADPATGLLLFDVVLGDGAHPDPAAVLAPAISTALAAASKAGRDLVAIAILVGTAADPQDRAHQAERLRAAGARVVASVAEAAGQVVRLLAATPSESLPAEEATASAPAPPRPVPLAALAAPLVAVNVGLETFADSLHEQEVEALHVDWRPPAGGDERLVEILDRIDRFGREAAEEETP